MMKALVLAAGAVTIAAPFVMCIGRLQYDLHAKHELG